MPTDTCTLDKNEASCHTHRRDRRDARHVKTLDTGVKMEPMATNQSVLLIKSDMK